MDFAIEILYICFHRFRASCIEDGSFFPRVSGRKTNTRMPPMREPVPMIRSGNGVQMVSRRAICGAMIPPILPQKELPPTAVLRISVGKSSAV